MSESAEHIAGRPGWDCLRCGVPWPCAPARAALATGHPDAVSLSILMWNFFDDYVQDTPPGSLTEAHERFLGWIGAARRTPP